jgi:hypothetical protein
MAKISLKRILLALGLVFALTGAVGIPIVWRGQQEYNRHMISPQVQSRFIIASVEVWQTEKRGCPTVQELLDEKHLDYSLATDQWGSRYLIECESETVQVRSLGPDRQLHTKDDVVVGKRREHLRLLGLTGNPGLQ